jgi:putative ABC transport system permease protein
MFLDALSRDSRPGARSLGRARLVTVIAAVTLAAGIGANTAVFSVVENVLLKPLPYPQADDIVSVRLSTPGTPGVQNTDAGLALSASMFFTFADENRSFEHIGIWSVARALVTGVAAPEEVNAFRVSEGVLETLGVEPVLGRSLSVADQRPGSATNVMLTYDYWQRRFGGDAGIIGRAITVMGIDMQIVGVMPQGFRIADRSADLIVPFQFDRARLILPTFDYRSVARLKPGTTIADADADIARMLPIWLKSWPPFPGGDASDYEAWRITPALRPLESDVVGDVSEVLWTVLGTIGVVLLIACANVTNLLLVRADGRQHDFAVRAALGAGTWRIGRQLLIESVLLALLGGAFGLALAYVALDALLAMAPAGLPRLDEIALDTRALSFALAASLFSGVLSGSIPAIRYTGRRMFSGLRSMQRNASASRERHRTQSLLVVGQVALALVLLVSSGLMIRSFQALRSVDPGFTDAAKLQTFRMMVPTPLVPDADRALTVQNEVLDALAAIPGVESAGFTTSMPLEGGPGEANAIAVEDPPFVPGDPAPPFRRYRYVSPGLFVTAGTRIVAGRELSWDDVYAERPVAMVSENLARELWGSPAAALGKRIAQATDAVVWREVIGVVQDVRDDGLRAPAPEIVYWPPRIRDHWLAGDFVTRQVIVVMRSARAGTASLLREIQQAVWSVNPSIPVASVRTMRDVYGRSLARTTFTLLMLGTAGAMALLLGVVGLYGMISYGVVQRKGEIAIRSALGEARSALVRRFVRHGLALAGLGIAIGLGAAAGAAQLITSLLYAVAPVDPLTYLAVALVLVTAAALASFVPACQAARIDPMLALREE